MKATIQIQDINSCYMEELIEDGVLCAIFGGKPTKDTSFAYDVSYYVGVGARSVYDFVGSLF